MKKIFHFITSDRYRVKPLVYSPYFIFLGVFFILIFVIAINWMSDLSEGKDIDKYIAHYILLFSILSAGIGWIVGAYVSARNARKQHTMDVLIAHIHDPIKRQCLIEIDAVHPLNVDEPLSEEEVKDIFHNTEDESKRKTEANIKYLLNQYEFISYCIRSKDLDYDIMCNVIRGPLCFLYNKYENYIKIARGETKLGGRVKNHLMFEHLKILHQDWSKKDSQ
jgi:archaellum biogenesis ATPase FlaH